MLKVELVMIKHQMYQPNKTRSKIKYCIVQRDGKVINAIKTFNETSSKASRYICKETGLVILFYYNAL